MDLLGVARRDRNIPGNPLCKTKVNRPGKSFARDSRQQQRARGVARAYATVTEDFPLEPRRARRKIARAIVRRIRIAARQRKEAQ